jgi:Flagellar biosynthesis protein, FliO
MAGELGGLAGWLMKRWRGRQSSHSRLALLDRITLAPRQSLALVEADGCRILIATSAEGGPAFYPLNERPGLNPEVRAAGRCDSRRNARVSW